jgi:hypothetical protein
MLDAGDGGDPGRGQHADGRLDRADQRDAGTGRIAIGLLDLADVRAVVPKQHRGDRRRVHGAHVEHPNA